LEASRYYWFILLVTKNRLLDVFLLINTGVILENFQSMLLNKMINFCKGAQCPASLDILACQNNDASNELQKRVYKHLNKCDFCGAEAEIYSRYPLPEENSATVEIPIHLLELAESLMNNRNRGSSLLENLLIENEDLAFSGA